MNLALTDPARFHMMNEKIVMRGTLTPQSFFLVGSVVHCDVFTPNSTCQICIQPFPFSWPRSTAVLGQILGLSTGSTLLYNSFRGGVSFSSWMAKTQTNQPLKPIPVNGQHHGPGMYAVTSLKNATYITVKAIRSWKEDGMLIDACLTDIDAAQYS